MPRSAQLAALALLLAPASVQAACPASSQDLAQTIQDALAAYAIMDTEAFFAAHAQARADVDCLETVLEPDDAAPFHGVDALAAFLSEDDQGSLASLRSAYAAQPSFSYPGEVAPPDSPLNEVLQAAKDAPAAETLPLASAPGFRLVIDGETATQRPTDRPYLLQVASDDWQLIWSGLLVPGDELPHAALDPARFARGSTGLAEALGADEYSPPPTSACSTRPPARPPSPWASPWPPWSTSASGAASRTTACSS